MYVCKILGIQQGLHSHAALGGVFKGPIAFRSSGVVVASEYISAGQLCDGINEGLAGSVLCE